MGARFYLFLARPPPLYCHPDPTLSSQKATWAPSTAAPPTAPRGL